jgi:hypothetical protein
MIFNVKGRAQSKGIGVGGRIMLKWILEKNGARIRNALLWLKMWSSDCECDSEPEYLDKLTDSLLLVSSF